MCSNATTVRGLLAEVPADDGFLIVDMEATPEHFTRGTVRAIDQLFLVAEPWFKSLETARRYHHLASDLGIGEIAVIANKLSNDDAEIVSEYCREYGFELAAEVPYDPDLKEAERVGAAPFDHAPSSPAVAAIRDLAARIGDVR